VSRAWCRWAGYYRGSRGAGTGLAGESLVEARWLQPFADSLLRLKRQQGQLADAQVCAVCFSAAAINKAAAV
jgi:hypothetical protein